MSVIRRADLTITQWRNGAGRKADIATGPGWLIGFAFLDADAPFSDYTGHDRTITLVEGPGFTLADAAGTSLPVTLIGRPAPFDGGWIVDCRIHGAPCVVVNVMTERAHWRHAAAVHRAVDLPPRDPSAAAEVLVVLAGTLTESGAIAGRYDAIRRTSGGDVSASADALIYRARLLPS
ncbi:MAG: HutD family protein [Alphaproteobacteria bacterium]|nr:HutD family protein [Alphaproteobacteria bacterium]